jgi:hypothetical protein
MAQAREFKAAYARQAGAFNPVSERHISGLIAQR